MVNPYNNLATYPKYKGRQNRSREPASLKAGACPRSGVGFRGQTFNLVPVKGAGSIPV